MLNQWIFVVCLLPPPPSIITFLVIFISLLITSCEKDLHELPEPEEDLNTAIELARQNLNTPEEKNFFDYHYLPSPPSLLLETQRINKLQYELL